MEWTQRQQMYFLLQSFILGFSLGMALDTITAFACLKRRRRWLWTDVVFGPFAAVVTFLGALLICDGQLYPVMLLGVTMGMIAEHIVVGRFLQWVIVRCTRMVCKIGSVISKIFRQFGQFIAKKWRCIHRRAKNRKKMGRFSKKDLNFS